MPDDTVATEDLVAKMRRTATLRNDAFLVEGSHMLYEGAKEIERLRGEIVVLQSEHSRLRARNAALGLRPERGCWGP